MGSPTKSEISGDVSVLPRSTGRQYDAVLRLSEALSQCREPEDLTKILSDQLREFLEFLQFYIIVYRELHGSRMGGGGPGEEPHGGICGCANSTATIMAGILEHG
jgi:hypothetical protein